MSIPTQMSLAGFIVSISDLQRTTGGGDRIRLRVGVEQWRHEADDTFTKLDPTYHDVVAYDTAASVIGQRFRPGDFFVASGYIHEYEIDQRGGSLIKEEFVARKIGHNANQTTYVVQRRPPHAPASAQRAVQHQPALGM
ncbi:single-stranded DNA-binding protein [Nocardioides seonyuensis]|uniref:Single-stranded DNA-binding protein n=1 Tax=Nocardioides seonyuensis TaxID=2518371 RepID=A0A4P7ILB6_9ACTN|nr:single-stranded DNA-binding protein [Nocardioides seonyuensis]QBX57317.1 single-stranded DNA-binding protein [Nocardioides seonyuensis]